MLAPQISARFHDEDSNLPEFWKWKGVQMTPGQQAWTADVLVPARTSVTLSWWLRLSTGLSYFIDCLINQTAKKKKIKLQSPSNHNEQWNGRVLKDWVRQQVPARTFLANLREELCLGPWFHQLLSPNWTESYVIGLSPSSGFCDYVALCPWQGTDGGTDVPLQGNDSGLHWLDTKWLSSREHPRDLELFSQLVTFS